MIRNFQYPILCSIISFGLLIASGCNSGSPATSGQSQQTNPSAGNNPTQSQPGLPVNVEPTNKPDFKYFSVIREFGGTDSAALFGIVPGTGTLDLSNVTGPSFLGSAHVGTLSQNTIDHFFLNSSQPMSEAEKNELLSKYNGASFVYFEGYNGQLCSDTQFKITTSGTIENLSTSTVFDFIAEPATSGDCSPSLTLPT